MSSVNLHALANTPGFGKAQDALKKLGHWNEDAAPGGKQYRVRVTAVVKTIYTKVFTVTAETQADAEEMAMGKADEDHGSGWHFSHEEDRQPVSAKVLDITRAET